VDFDGYPERAAEVNVLGGIRSEGFAGGAIMEPRPDPVHTTTRIFWPGENKRAQVAIQLSPVEQGTRVDQVYGGIGLVRDKGKTAPKTAVNDYYREPVPDRAPTQMGAEILNIGGGLKTSRRTEWVSGQTA